MQKLLKKGANGFVAQLCSLEVPQSNTLTHPNLQEIIDCHSVILGDMPKGLEICLKDFLLRGIMTMPYN